MKKILLLAVVLGAAVSTFAQGTVSFQNGTTSLITTNNGTSGSVAGTTGAYRYELMVAPAGQTDRSQFTILATITNSPSLAGRLFGGTVSNNVVVPGGAFAVFVRGWLAAGPAETDYASASLKGETASILQLAASGNPTTVPPGTPSPIFGAVGSGLLNGFVLTQTIPEPSSIALGLLGLGAIALFRRRK